MEKERRERKLFSAERRGTLPIDPGELRGFISEEESTKSHHFSLR